MKLTKKKSRERHNRLHTIEIQLRSLLNNVNVNEARVTEIENEIKTIYDLKANGAQIRSRIKFFEEGEKNTKYFLSLEKSRQTRKASSSLVVNGKRITKI